MGVLVPRTGLYTLMLLDGFIGLDSAELAACIFSSYQLLI